MAKTVSGRVTDSDTGAGISLATVFESGRPDNFTQTGTDGSYSLLIASDTGAIVFNADGYLDGAWSGNAGATTGSISLYKTGKVLNLLKAKAPAVLVTSFLIVILLLLSKKIFKI